ncbi:MAG: hypothetical protein ACTJHE_15405, partial [Vibrio casei]
IESQICSYFYVRILDIGAQIGCTFIVAQVLQQNLAFPNQKLNVFQMPHELLSTDVGICYKKEINIIEPIKLLIKLAEENLQIVM